ncbi:hypothetical protein SMACR_12792 [Sordaria macrospora]|nr:hypothetical protein SMACR_12792 [Sordaria macrospora]
MTDLKCRCVYKCRISLHESQLSPSSSATALQTLSISSSPTTISHPIQIFNKQIQRQPTQLQRPPPTQVTMPNSIYCNADGCENDKVFSGNKQHQYCSTHKCADSSCGQRNKAGSIWCGTHKDGK